MATGMPNVMSLVMPFVIPLGARSLLRSSAASGDHPAGSRVASACPSIGVSRSVVGYEIAPPGMVAS
jgi:hypothetical protein